MGDPEEDSYMVGYLTATKLCALLRRAAWGYLRPVPPRMRGLHLT